MTDNVKKAIKYAKDVIAGKIPACRFIVKTCQQFIDDILMKLKLKKRVNSFNIYHIQKASGHQSAKISRLNRGNSSL